MEQCAYFFVDTERVAVLHLNAIVESAHECNDCFTVLKNTVYLNSSINSFKPMTE